jgi:hypothetical protein
MWLGDLPIQIFQVFLPVVIWLISLTAKQLLLLDQVARRRLMLSAS